MFCLLLGMAMVATDDRGEDLLLACRFADSDGTVENRQAVVLSASRLSCGTLTKDFRLTFFFSL